MDDKKIPHLDHKDLDILHNTRDQEDESRSNGKACFLDKKNRFNLKEKIMEINSKLDVMIKLIEQPGQDCELIRRVK